MTDVGLRTRKFDPRQASSEEFAAMNVFDNRKLEESRPGDPPRSWLEGMTVEVQLQLQR